MFQLYNARAERGGGGYFAIDNCVTQIMAMYFENMLL